MDTKDTYFSSKYTINCRGRLVDLSNPIVMGIVNITPDSFYKGNRYTTDEEVIKRVETVLFEGATMIDVGAYSSRPGAELVPEEEEKRRLKSALIAIRKNFKDVIISLDTFRASIAQWAVEEFEVSLINDISAGNMDPGMFDAIARLKVPYIIMHMQGTPQVMQLNPQYSDVIQEVLLFLSQKVHLLKQKGVNDIIIDPGFGFGKSLEHNYRLMSQLEAFRMFELPLLVGVSRKSMICKLLHCSPEKALNGTTALHTIALLKGASILRVHDVREAVETIEIVKKLNDQSFSL